MQLTRPENEALRAKGWSVFRSSTRDRIVPVTGSGRTVQRLKINEAYPVGDIEVGSAVSPDERARVAALRGQAFTSSLDSAESRPIGVSTYMPFTVSLVNAALPAGENNDHFVRLVVAPYDGFLTELVVVTGIGGNLGAFAIRSTSGQTMFRSGGNRAPLVGSPSLLPDFCDLNSFGASNDPITLRNLRMPVFAGDEITCVFRDNTSSGPPLVVMTGILGFEAFVLARPGSQASQSQFMALNTQAIISARETAVMANKIDLERERTRRAEIEAESRVKVAAINSAAKQPPAMGQYNPFNNVLMLPGAQQQLQSRAVTPPAAPRIPAPKPAPPDGTGQTFVQAWMPSASSIGYLIPDPPRGGKVNVFDGKYTVWGPGGERVSEGMVQTIPSGGVIPEGARLSR